MYTNQTKETTVLDTSKHIELKTIDNVMNLLANKLTVLNKQVKENKMNKLNYNMQFYIDELEYHVTLMGDFIKALKSEAKFVEKKNKQQTVKREWYNYTLPSVLLDATKARGYTTWKDLTSGSKNGFRHKILLWALPKVNSTYKKRIKTIINSHYKV